jgi:gas vesicle protein
MATLRVNVTSDNVIKGKFHQTALLIESFYRETGSTLADGADYTAEEVNEKMQEIRNSFYEEMEQLSKDIELTTHPA